MPYQEFEAADVQTAVQKLVRFLEYANSTHIYFHGWDGLGASAVLRAIAEHPPPSLLEKFDKIIHIDCSMWKSRRALPRAIVDALELTQQVAADFAGQDEEDDFSGIDQGSRAEIRAVTTVIARSLAQYRCLVVFHDGGDFSVDYLTRCGILQPELFNTKVLWNFGGRLHFKEEFWRMPASSFILYSAFSGKLNALLEKEAREISLYTYKLGLGVNPEIATECCLYLLSLNHRGGNVIDYNWATHASSYWVCDGIVQGGQRNQAWELARALQQQIRLEGYSSSNKEPAFGYQLDISTKHWICIVNSSFEEVPPETTSLFFAPPTRSVYVSFPKDRFYEADRLRVLKLCWCEFSFSSPPFHCCHNLRFLGLHSCKHAQHYNCEEKRTGAAAVETFQRLWVLDVSHTDWELDFPLETEQPVVATDIREVHVNKGRIWRSNFAWRRLPNLRKLRVVKPTRSWETGRQDEFMDMDKLELLDLTGNKTMQVLPKLSGATGLKTLVLDGCVGLGHVGPQGLPPSLESFCLDTGEDEDHGKNDDARISRISLAGCARLVDLRLCGSLPKLEELDLSHTALKMIDLTKVTQVANLERVFLVGCEQLRSIRWPYSTGMRQLRLLCIDTRPSSGQEVARKPWPPCDPLLVVQDRGEEEYCHVFVAMADMRFLESIEQLIRSEWRCASKVRMNFCWSSTVKDDGRGCYKNKMGHEYSSSTVQVAAAGSPLQARSSAYHDVSTDERQITTTLTDGSSGASSQFQPLDAHFEIGEGASDVPDAVSSRGLDAINYVTGVIKSLHVHDSSSITAVYPERFLRSTSSWIMYELRCCHVERCPRLQTVFAVDYAKNNFRQLETFWAAHLLMARSIWHSSIPRTPRSEWSLDLSFAALRAIHLHFCPRLRYVLILLSSKDDLANQLETLHIFCCGDLRQVFPVDPKFQDKIAASRATKGMLGFPKLKHLHLHHLSSLQLVCEAKMYAPNLETVYIRGCWGLRRLPATTDGRPVAVDCEKDWWDKLEWDGMESGHHPSLFQPRHSKYYKKRHLRGTVLR